MNAQIDYSPLDEKNPKPVKPELTNSATLSAVLGAVFVTVIFRVFIEVPLYILAVVFLVCWRTMAKGIASSVRLSNFAVKNGFHYSWTKTGSSKGIKLSGVINSAETRISASNVISGTYGDFTFKLFTFYRKGGYTIMTVQLHNQYPHIVLDSKANDKAFGSNISKFFGEESRIHLEGDFENYFKAYAKAPVVDTLRILSPDMMQLMIDSGHKYDIEIVGNSLNIISNYKYADSTGTKYFFDIADTLLSKLDRRSVTKQATFDSTSRVS